MALGSSRPVHWVWSSSQAYTDSKYPLALPSLPLPGTPFPSQQPLHSSGLHSGDACAQSLPKASLGVCRSPSLPASSSPVSRAQDPVPFLLCISSSSHPSPLSDTLSSTTEAWTRRRVRSCLWGECRLVREEGRHFLGHP